MPFRLPVSNLLANEFFETFQVLAPLHFEWPICSKPRNQQRLGHAGRENFDGRRGLVSSRLGQPMVDLDG